MSYNRTYPEWCVDFTCPDCRKSWFVCKVCAPLGKQKNRLTSPIERHKHNKLHESVQLSQNDSVSYLKRKKPAVSKDDLERVLCEDKLVEFFTNEICGMGKSSLVGKQIYRSNLQLETPEDDVNLHLLISMLLVRISRGDMRIFGRILAIIVKKHTTQIKRMEQHLKGIERSMETLAVPSSENALRQYVEGKFSIVSNSPIPYVNTTIDGSAYVLPSNVLRLYHSFKLNPHKVFSRAEINAGTVISSYWQTKAAEDIFESLECVGSGCGKILLLLWSDGFDPNSSNKSNRGSVKAISMTVLAEDDLNDYRHTFLLCLCREDSDLQEIWTKNFEDLESLRKPQEFFDGENIVRLQHAVICCIHDRPERSYVTGISSHNGTYTVRFGYISETGNDKIFSCPLCFSYRKKNIFSAKSRACRSCYDYDSMRVKGSVPDGYPLEINAIESRKMSFTEMNKSVSTAYNNLMDKKWGIGQVRAFLRAAGVSRSIVDKLIALSKLEERESGDYESILPPVWSTNIALNAFIETPMHLLFLGVTKTVGYVIKKSLGANKVYSLFHKFSHPLDKIRSFSLDWCKALTFGSIQKPFGPWVSKNHVAFARIMKTIYFSITHILDNNDENAEYLKDIFFLVTSWNSVVSRLMQKTVTESSCADAERHIKIFLR